MRLQLVCVCFVAFSALGLGACPQKRCTTAADCALECDCDDPNQNVVVQCGLQFRCDATVDLCAEDFNTASCSDVCDLYPKDKCYSRQCTSENDCVRDVECNVDQNGMITTLPCSFEFACDADDNLCESAFTASDLEICQMCLEAGLFGVN